MTRGFGSRRFGLGLLMRGPCGCFCIVGLSGSRSRGGCSGSCGKCEHLLLGRGKSSRVFVACPLLAPFRSRDFFDRAARRTMGHCRVSIHCSPKIESAIWLDFVAIRSLWLSLPSRDRELVDTLIGKPDMLWIVIQTEGGSIRIVRGWVGMGREGAGQGDLSVSPPCHLQNTKLVWN